MSKLSIWWVRWRLREYNYRVANGFPRDAAWRFTKAEAKLRNRVARVIGNRAAEELKLDFVDGPSGTRFILCGALEGLPPEKLTALQQLRI